jgi:hypothetical protein
VTVGLNDDTNAEIRSGELQVGDQVVTAVAAPDAAGKSKAATAPSLHV